MTMTAASALTIRVLLFGSYAESLGAGVVELTLSSPATIADVIARLRTLPGGDRLPARPLCARNLSQVTAETSVSAGD